MENYEFLKELSILYVEDSKSLQSITKAKMSQYFKDIYVADDGERAIKIYNFMKTKGIRIDAIISDINMPNMDGIQLLKVIRKDNLEVPFIFTTSHLNNDYLLQAIKLNATEYIIKPIDITDAIKKIAKECRIKLQNEQIKLQKIQAEQYLEAIDKVAIILKLDSDRNIIFANSYFYNITGYTKNEIINKPYDLIKHPDISSEFYKNIWNTVSSGETWQGKLKNIKQDDEEYYVNTTIIPNYDEQGLNIIEYNNIGFLITNDELKNREFKKRVIQSFQENRKKEQNSTTYIKNLEKQIKDIDPLLNKKLQEIIEEEKNKNLKLKTQLTYYENEIKEFENKYNKMINISNEKLRKSYDFAKKLKELNDKFDSNIKLLKNELLAKEEIIKEMSQTINDYKKNIADLKDVISHREEQLASNSNTSYHI